MATWYIGQLYREGNGVEKDPSLALKYFEKAAETGNTFCTNFLGAYYYNGNDVERDFNKSFKYFLLSAENNDESANYNVAISYHFGIKKNK